ncbi:TPR-containing protein DDB_G0280363-like [Drosophila virilis]|uniref:TPR-containing protein DDB_G0280363-like n=1 Tax=Drosophila virilis TaxID=7244 RepID=UPI0038B29001
MSTILTNVSSHNNNLNSQRTDGSNSSNSSYPKNSFNSGCFNNNPLLQCSAVTTTSTAAATRNISRTSANLDPRLRWPKTQNIQQQQQQRQIEQFGSMINRDQTVLMQRQHLDTLTSTRHNAASAHHLNQHEPTPMQIDAEFQQQPPQQQHHQTPILPSTEHNSTTQLLVKLAQRQQEQLDKLTRYMSDVQQKMQGIFRHGDDSTQIAASPSSSSI